MSPAAAADRDRRTDHSIAELLGIELGSWPEHDPIHRGGWYCSHCTAYIVWCGRCKQEWCPDCHDSENPPPPCEIPPPHYSTDLAAAETLLPWMRARGYSCAMRYYVAGFDGFQVWFWRIGDRGYGEGQTFAEAIVAAFLAAGREEGTS